MTAVHLFNHPVVAALLLTLAFLGLVVEVRSVGFHRAGWAGLVALGLFVASHLAEGIPAWRALPILGGVVLLWPALEDPDRWRVGAAGIALAAAGAYLVMVGPGPAHLDHARALAVLAATALLVLLAATAVWMRLPASARPRHRSGVFFFKPPADGAVEEAMDESPVGREGVAATALQPDGWALVEGDRRPALAEGEWVDEGEPVEVLGDDGLHLRVRRRPDDAAPG